MNSVLARRWRGLTLGADAALLSLVLAWQLWPPPTIAGAVRGLLLSVPLFLPVRGLWQGKRHSYRWATLCVMPYFVVGMTEVIADKNARPWTAAMLTLALMWFVTLVAYLRVTAAEMPNNS